MEFQAFPKMARLSREIVVTEKIDGTNAQIAIFHERDLSPACAPLVLAAIRTEAGPMLMLAGSRTRWITPEADNFSFARWAKEHAQELFALGEGRHFGEWWGQGVQRGYGLTEKRFSLFNVSRWADDRDIEKFPEGRPACCHVVPVIGRGNFDAFDYRVMLSTLESAGSYAAPGFMKPEGIVVYHVAAGIGFKKTIEKDEQPKSRSEAA